MPATILLRALGYSTEELLNFFYRSEKVYLEEGKKVFKSVVEECLEGQIVSREVRDPESREVIARKGKKWRRASIRKLKAAAVSRIPVNEEDLEGKVLAHDIINKDTGEVLFEANEELTLEKIQQKALILIIWVIYSSLSSLIKETRYWMSPSTANQSWTAIWFPPGRRSISGWKTKILSYYYRIPACSNCP